MLDNDRRKEARTVTDAPVTVTVLATGQPETRQDGISGRILDMSGSGLLLGLPAAVPCGSPVKIEGSDMLLLGEVCRTESNPGPGAKEYRVGVTVRHSLSRLAQLESLNRALLGHDRDPVFPAPTPLEETVDRD